MEEYESIDNGLTFSFTIVGKYRKYPIVNIQWKAIKGRDICGIPIQMAVMASTGRKLIYVSQEQRSHVKARQDCIEFIDKDIKFTNNLKGE